MFNFPLSISKSGFSLIELVIVLAIIVLVATLAFNPFTNFRNEQALNGAAEEILSTLQQARGQTIASTGDSQYGVHLTATQLVVFTGSTYSVGAATNQTIELNSLVTLGPITLAGGGSEVVFERLTGATSQSGTLVVALKSDAAKTRTITINGNGISDVN